MRNGSRNTRGAISNFNVTAYSRSKFTREQLFHDFLHQEALQSDPSLSFAASSCLFLCPNMPFVAHNSKSHVRENFFSLFSCRADSKPGLRINASNLWENLQRLLQVDNFGFQCRRLKTGVKAFLQVTVATVWNHHHLYDDFMQLFFLCAHREASDLTSELPIGSISLAFLLLSS